MARILVVAGLLIAFVGLVLWLFPRAFAWFGNLPGDIRIERGETRIFIPLTSMLLASVVLTLFLNIVARIFGRGG